MAGLCGTEAIAHRAFVDVGANIGTTTIPAVRSYGFAKAARDRAGAGELPRARLNVLLNDLEERVVALPVAISNVVGHSELVVNRGRGGKHWIATDRSKLKKKDSGPETAILRVETVTLDHLAEDGVIDPDATGMLWMDAEAHEGHILEGATSLLSRGTPARARVEPDESSTASGTAARSSRRSRENYTHFAGMHRDHDGEGPGFPLLPVDGLSAYAERYLDPANPTNKTDILAMRLTPQQAEGVDGLDTIVKRGAGLREASAA